MTISQFRKRALAAFLKANPDLENATTRWVFGPRRSKTPDGTVQVHGQFYVTADGYKSRRMYASWDADNRQLMVR